MNGRYLLDTNIIIALFADDVAVIQHLANAEETFVPSVAIGELCYGAYKSARVQDNLVRIDGFAASSAVLGCNAETARVYGASKNALRLKGRPLPENDIWIAAIALQYHLTLVTRDAHFSEIAGLLMTLW